MLPRNPSTSTGFERMMETTGGLDQAWYFHLFPDRAAFIEKVKDKKIADLGSGSGKLAMDLYAQALLDDFNVDITSINPRYNYEGKDPGIEKLHKADIGYFLMASETVWQLKKKFPDRNIEEEILSRFNSSKSDSSWDSLKFPDNYFDYIFATQSYIFYPHTFSISSLKEIMRVIKPGGTFSVSFNYGDATVDQFKVIEDEIMANGFKLEVNYSQTHPKFDRDADKTNIGVMTITK